MDIFIPFVRGVMVELRAAGRSQEEAEHPTHIMAFLLF